MYSVVFFHAGISELSGEFVGVDLFFVLSGFLVTNVVLAECDEGSFSPVRFWARRFRRLLPAALMVIVGSAIVFGAITTPAERELALGDARSATLYFANWRFLSVGSDYFASEDLPRPFTHFWSLSIEEQFYFVFPVLVLVAIMVARRLQIRTDRSLGALLIVLIAASATSQICSALHSPSRAYYATDARIYQILLGSLAAVGLRSPAVRSWFTSRIRAGSDVVLIVALAVFILLVTNRLDILASSRGLLAAFVSLVVIAGLEVAPNSRVGRFLSNKAVVYLGRLSYGTYLWHWPVIVIVGRLVDLGPWSLAVVAIVSSTILADVSARALEVPIRRSTFLNRVPRTTVAVGLSASVTVGILAVPGILKSDRPSILRQTSSALSGSPYAESIDFSMPEKVDWRAAKDDIPDLPDCTKSSPEDCIVVKGGPGRLHIHLIGDSHARTLIPAMSDLARVKGWTFSATVVGGCPWQRDLRHAGKENAERDERCDVHQVDWYDRVIPALKPDVIVLFNRAFDDEKFRRRMFIDGEDPKQSTQYEIVRRTTQETVGSLVAAGYRAVALEQLPLSSIDVTACLSGAESLRDCSFLATEGPLPTELVLRDLDRANSAMVSVDIDRVVCPQLPLCLPIIDGIIVRRDAHHLTGTFARQVVMQIYDSIRETGILDGLPVTSP